MKTIVKVFKNKAQRRIFENIIVDPDKVRDLGVAVEITKCGIRHLLITKRYLTDIVIDDIEEEYGAQAHLFSFCGVKPEFKIVQKLFGLGKKITISPNRRIG